MPPLDLSTSTVVITGAGRGFGRATAIAMTSAGARVVGVARTAGQLTDLESAIGPGFIPHPADGTDEAVATNLLAEYRPQLLVLNAGAVPPLGPVHRQTWHEFSTNWEVDVKQAFGWIGAALRLPLPPGSRVVVLSSGAAIKGSPLSGGYAGAKATVRFISGYAAEESRRAGLDISFTALLPQLTPTTDLGRLGAAGYADREGVSLQEFTERLQPVLTPEAAAAAIVGLAQQAEMPGHSYLLTGAGMRELDT